MPFVVARTEDMLYLQYEKGIDLQWYLQKSI